MHQGTIYVIPQSHIDVAWLWRYDPETIHRCCKPTFTLATDNMDRYPDYTFSQSQVSLYTAIEEAYPELFAKIKFDTMNLKSEILLIEDEPYRESI